MSGFILPLFLKDIFQLAYNFVLTIFLFQNFKDVSLFSSLHCFLWEVCYNLYYNASVSYVFSFWLLVVFFLYQWFCHLILMQFLLYLKFFVLIVSMTVVFIKFEKFCDYFLSFSFPMIHSSCDSICIYMRPYIFIWNFLTT